MTYLSIVDFTSKRVVNPRMLQPGGVVMPGSYTRTRRNTPVSPGLLQRMKFTAGTMAANCRIADKCLPAGMNRAAIGQPVPGKPGKVYVECTSEEAARRLRNARECAIRQLSTKGGIYSKIVA